MSPRSLRVEQSVGGNLTDAEAHAVRHSSRTLRDGAVKDSMVGIPGPRSLMARLGSALLVIWAAVTGVAPHVLHHVGPLAGAAFLAGAGGRLLFAAIALTVSIPFLLRIYRRFQTWIAPAIAILVMAAAFSLSTFVVGPAIGDEGPEPPPKVGERSEHDHTH